MKSIWDNPWFLIPALLFLNAGLLLAFFVPYGQEILMFNGLREEPFNTAFRFLTLLGEFYPFVIFGIAAMFRRYRFAILIALAGLITLPTVYLLKEGVGADRPITWFKNRGMRESVITVPDVELNTGRTSFPSGHTMAAFGLYSLLALMSGKKHPRRAAAFALLAILVGISRIFLVQHFLADVLAGSVLGLAVGALVWRLNDTAFFNRLRFLDKRIDLRKRRSLRGRRGEKPSNGRVF